MYAFVYFDVLVYNGMSLLPDTGHISSIGTHTTSESSPGTAHSNNATSKALPRQDSSSNTSSPTTPCSLGLQKSPSVFRFLFCVFNCVIITNIYLSQNMLY